MAIISLENMEFHAFHGCLEHEKMFGNTFVINLSMEIDTQRAGQTDELNDTLNYQLVYDEIKAQMQIPSQLIEHVAQRILDKIMDKFLVIQKLDIKVSKMNPPLGAKVQSVSISLSKSR